MCSVYDRLPIEFDCVVNQIMLVKLLMAGPNSIVNGSGCNNDCLFVWNRLLVGNSWRRFHLVVAKRGWRRGNVFSPVVLFFWCNIHGALRCKTSLCTPYLRIFCIQRLLPELSISY